MSNDEKPVYKPPRFLGYLAGIVVFQILNSLYWAFAGGLGWGFGSAIGSYVPWLGADFVGGSIGLAMVLFAVLTIDPAKNQRTEYTPIQLALFGGAAAGYVSLALLFLINPLGRNAWLDRNVTLLFGAGGGVVVGLFTVVMKQYFAPVHLLRACTIAITGSALFAGIGSLVDGPLGWAAAGGIALFAVAMFAEWWRQEPAVEFDANEQPVGVIPRGEMCRHTARQSWYLTHPDAWGWHGFFAGLAATLWVEWAAVRNVDTVRHAYLLAGGLAILVTVATRLGIGKPAQRANAENRLAQDEGTPPQQQTLE
jgi:hypothetical protein